MLGQEQLAAGASGEPGEGGWEKAVQNFAVTFLAEGQQDLQSSSLSLGQS